MGTIKGIGKVLVYIILTASWSFSAYAKDDGSYWYFFKERTKEVANQTVEFWAPIAKKTVDKSKPVAKRTIEYWSPKVQPVIERTAEYWSPRLETAYDKSSLYFLDKIHPLIINGYNWYYDHAGKHIGGYALDAAESSYAASSQAVRQFQNRFRSDDPITYHFLADVPAFIKKGYENFILYVWKKLKNANDSDIKKVAGDKMVMAEMAIQASASINKNAKTKESKHLNSLLDDIRPHVRDKGMESCYEVVYLEFDILNAFNIGCRIFLTNEMYEMFKEDDRFLRAILAHEVAHGDRGHGIKTFMTLASSLSGHFGEVAFKELSWVLTGETFEYLDEVAVRGNMDMAMERLAYKAPAVEIDADRHAAKILMLAGYSEYDLIDALKILHDAGDMSECEGLLGEGEDKVKRLYPNFCERREAILEEANKMKQKYSWL